MKNDENIMKNIIKFEKYKENNIKINEGIFTPKIDFITKYKSVLVYYELNNNIKNLEYWLTAIINSKDDKTMKRIKNALNIQYDKLKPRFSSSPGGKVINSNDNLNIIKQMNKNSHHYDNMILKFITTLLRGKYNQFKETLMKKLDIKETVLENNILLFNDF